MGDVIVTDAPRRTAKQWGGPLRPPARKESTGELVIEDAKPADPSSGLARAEAVRIVMPALELPEPAHDDTDIVAGELDDLEELPELPRAPYRIIAVVAAVVVATTWFLLVL